MAVHKLRWLEALVVAAVTAAAGLTPNAASARATLHPVELRAVQAAPAQGGIAVLALKVPTPGRHCRLEADSPLVAVANPGAFDCPTNEMLRGVYLPANTGKHRQRWWVTLLVTDRAGRTSQHGLALQAKSATWPGHRPLARVGIVGDSITNMSNNAMVDTMAGSYSLRIDGRNGFLIGQQLPTLRNTEHGPYGRANAMVVELGTNNAVYAVYSHYWVNDPSLPHLTKANGNWRAQLDAELRILRGVRCGLLVNVTTSTEDEAFNAQAREINAAIAAAVAEHPRLHLIDWAGALSAHPDWYGHGNLLAEIHPLEVGQQGLAQMINAALAQHCGLTPGAAR